MKTHFIFEEGGEAVSGHEESRPVSYSPPEYGTKWGTCPISLMVSDFSHSLGRRAPAGRRRAMWSTVERRRAVVIRAVTQFWRRLDSRRRLCYALPASL